MDSSRPYRIVPVADVKARAFLVTDGTQTVLIDSGMRGSARAVLRAARAVDKNSVRLNAIVLTHWHIDHSGSAAKIRQKSGAPVYIHPADRPWLEGTAEPSLPNADTRRGRFVQWLLRKLYRTCPVDFEVLDGTILPLVGGLRAVHVPGHTPGSICLMHEPTRSLFLGDALIRRSDRWELPAPQFTDDLDMARRSLERLRHLDVAACYFGHGESVVIDAERALSDAVDRLSRDDGNQALTGSTVAPAAK